MILTGQDKRGRTSVLCRAIDTVKMMEKFAMTHGSARRAAASWKDHPLVDSSKRLIEQGWNCVDISLKREKVGTTL